MSEDFPKLEALMHRLSETPAEFLQTDIIDVTAIVCDQLRTTGATLPPDPAATFEKARCSSAGLLSLAAWLLHDDWFLSRRALAPAVAGLFAEGFAALAEWVKPADVVNDPDRREEFVRLCLARMNLRPAGETESQAKDRLTSLDSAERVRVARQMRDAEARARKIREEMARKAAQAAASRYSSE